MPHGRNKEIFPFQETPIKNSVNKQVLRCFTLFTDFRIYYIKSTGAKILLLFKVYNKEQGRFANIL